MFGDSWIKKFQSWRDEGHVSRYPIIPDDVTPWPNRGVQFVDANAFLAWGEPEGAVVQKLLDSGMMKNLCTEGTVYSDIRTLFMGHRVQIILNYFPEFEDPHVENTLAVCHLVDWPKGSHEDYLSVQKSLADQIGQPTDQGPTLGYPNLPRSLWDFEYSRVLLAVELDRSDNLELRLRFRRKGLPKWEEWSEKHGAKHF